MKHVVEKKNRVLFFLVILFGLTTPGQASEYRVVVGDSLSVIAKRFSKGPVYGRNGSLQKFLALNPQIKNPHLVRTGLKINLPREIDIVEDSSFRKVASQEDSPQSIVIQSSPVIANSDKKENESSAFALEFRPQLGFAALSGRDKTTQAEAKLASDLGPAVGAKVIAQWDESWRAYLGIQSQFLNFRNSTSRNIEGRRGFTNRLSIGTIYSWNSFWELGTEAGYGDQLFFYSSSPTSLKLERASRSDFSGFFQLPVLRNTKFAFVETTQMTAYFPTSTERFTAPMGYGFKIGLEMIQSKKPKGARGGIFYEESRYSSNISTQKLRRLGVSFTFFWGDGS